MASQQYREQGIAAAKARRTDEARKLLLMAVKLDPNDALAWLYLASVTNDKKERLLFLQKVLLIDAENDLARKAVQSLGVDPDQLIALGKQMQKPAPPPPPPPADEPSFTEDSAPEDDSDDIDINVSPYDLEDADDTNDDVDIYASPYDDDDDDIDINVSPYDFDDDSAPASTPAFVASDEDERYSRPIVDPYTDEVFDDAMDGVFSAAPTPPPAPATPAPRGTGALRPPPADPSRGGIPIPDRQYLTQVLAEAESVIESYGQPPENVIAWTSKKKNRAGEVELTRYRLQVISAIVGSLLVIGIIGAVILATNPEAQRVVLNIRTTTPTFTPTFTPSPTPGQTATPSPTIDFTANPTFTPSPTFNATFTPISVLNVRTPRPTQPPLPGQLEINVARSFAEMNAGGYANAVATLDVERRLVSNNFNPNPYYASGIALMLDGQTERAFEVMEEAAERAANTSGSDAPIFESIVDLGFAEIHLLRAADQIQAGRGAGNDLAAVEDRADEALAFDPRYARAYVLKARAAVLAGDYDDALMILNEGRAVQGLGDDLTLLTEQAEILLQQGQQQAESNDTRLREEAIATLQEAEYIASLTLHLNPYEERAHLIRTQAALAQGRAGQAVLYTETWRIAAPESPNAFRMLGDARIAEGNQELALGAYTRAVELGAEPAALVNALQARAELFAAQRRYDLALADFNSALELTDSPEVRARRMITAYAAGQYDTAIADADLLIGTGALPDGDIRLVKARALIDTAPEGVTAQVREAYDLLNSASVSESQRAVWEEYRARAAFALGEYEAAAQSIIAALQGGISGSRYYLRGQIEEARAVDLLAAVRSYEWVTGWSQVYGYPFAEDAAARLTALETSVAATATIAALTVTPEGTLTETPQP